MAKAAQASTGTGKRTDGRPTAPRREAATATAARAAAILAGLEHDYPEAECALLHRNAFELLVATILSAQCTDARVNMVTPELFRRWPDARSLAKATQEDVEKVIHSTGFYRNKAKNLLGMAQAVVARHGGEVPDTMDALTALPGAARKTANVVLGTWFKKAEGVVVDTHVGRIAGKLVLTQETDPARIERDLMEMLPRSAWTSFSHRVILHGRRICDARKPKCAACSLREMCPSREDERASVASAAKSAKAVKTPASATSRNRKT